MINTKFRFAHLIYGLALIVADLLVFVILGLLLMGYDDNYNSSKGEYWSFASMRLTEKIIYISYNVWVAINIASLAFIAFKLYKQKSHNTL